MPPTSNLSKELGVDSPITKNREGVDLPLAYTYLLSYDNKSKKANCISVTKRAFDLQNMLFEYKSGFSITKILFYKKIRSNEKVNSTLPMKNGLFCDFEE